MKDTDVMAVIKTHMQGCAGWSSDGIQSARTDALNYYLQRKRGDEVTGRSTVVSGDVSASVEANLAQMLDAYTTDNIAEFDPLGPEDEDAAQLETDAVIHFLMKVQNGFTELAAATKDALLSRNGIVKVWVEPDKRTITRTFDNVAPEAVEPTAENAGAQVVSYDRSTGVLVTRQEITGKRFRAEAVAPENFYYPVDAESFDVQRIAFCCERHVDSRSDLLAMGFKRTKVDQLKPFGGSTASRPDANARDPGGMVTTPPQFQDASLDRIEWFEAYMLLDNDGDGIAERRRVAFSHASDVVLENEPVALVPYAMGVVLIMPHRITGISQYDKLRHVQDEHTGLKRARYDNVNTVTKNRLAYLDGQVNVDDVGDGRPNGAIRVRSDAGVADVRQAVMPFVVPDNTANILQNIEALKRERTELGGAALELATGQLQIGGDRMGSQGLDRAYSVMEQLAALMTKTFASTLLRSLFLLSHATLREHFTEPVNIKRNGKWFSPIPAKWPARERVTIKVGMSPNERARKANALMTILNSQIQLAGQGMDEVLVNVIGFYRTLMDWARVSDVQNPEQYFIDPESPKAKQAFEVKAQAAQRAQMKREALMTQAVGIEQVRAAIDKYKSDQETQFKYWEATLDAEIEEAKLAGAATVDLLKSKRDANGKDTNGGADSASQTDSEQ
jgi:hypothetical protein